MSSQRARVGGAGDRERADRRVIEQVARRLEDLALVDVEQRVDDVVGDAGDRRGTLTITALDRPS
jgi:hypothetical protein